MDSRQKPAGMTKPELSYPIFFVGYPYFSWIPDRAAFVRNDLVVVDSRLTARLKAGGQWLMTYGFPPGNCGNDKTRTVIPDIFCRVSSFCDHMDSRQEPAGMTKFETARMTK